MIEAIVRYFEDRGFNVSVLFVENRGVLVISKGNASFDWCISQIDLQDRNANHYLFDCADLIMLTLNEALQPHETPS